MINILFYLLFFIAPSIVRAHFSKRLKFPINESLINFSYIKTNFKKRNVHLIVSFKLSSLCLKILRKTFCFLVLKK